MPGQHRLHRRGFLRAAAALAFPLFTTRPLHGDIPGQIIRQKEPVNLEFPFAGLDSFITPNELFFARCHFPIPRLERKSWKLKIEGAVERPLELSYDDLLKMQTRTLVSVLE